MPVGIYYTFMRGLFVVFTLSFAPVATPAFATSADPLLAEFMRLCEEPRPLDTVVAQALTSGWVAASAEDAAALSVPVQIMEREFVRDGLQPPRTAILSGEHGRRRLLLYVWEARIPDRSMIHACTVYDLDETAPPAVVAPLTAWLGSEPATQDQGGMLLHTWMQPQRLTNVFSIKLTVVSPNSPAATLLGYAGTGVSMEGATPLR